MSVFNKAKRDRILKLNVGDGVKFHNSDLYSIVTEIKYGPRNTPILFTFSHPNTDVPFTMTLPELFRNIPSL